jgi:hypothetical protein
MDRGPEMVEFFQTLALLDEEETDLDARIDQ